MDRSVNTYILATPKPWHDGMLERLQESTGFSWRRVTTKEELSLENLRSWNVSKVFLPHWSWWIPEEIIDEFDCVIFHMTDLPFGRGGSPLQNLVVRGIHETKITALQAVKELDAGDVYLKRPLSLDGSAREIFERSGPVVEGMIRTILSENPKPVPQEGEVIEFKRRRPEESEIPPSLNQLSKLYDWIRMLDCEGYPPAFLDLGVWHLEFTGARIEGSDLSASVRFIRKIESGKKND